MNKYSPKEFLSGLLMICLLLYGAHYLRSDSSTPKLNHFFSVVGVLGAVGVAILMIRRLSEMYLWGYLRDRGFARGEELNVLQKIFSALVSFIYRITHPIVLCKFLDRSRTNRMLRKREQFDEKCWDEHYEAKKTAIETILGPMDDIVGHSIIPFDIGGALDMYYFSSCLAGTVFCSMELIDPDGEGPVPSRMGTYELVSCTKHKNTSTTKEPPEERAKRIEEDHLTPFERIQHRMCGTMTTLARYSFQAILNPNETCEVPVGDSNGNRCLIFDDFNSDGTVFKVKDKTHGLLLCIEVFRSEMEYAMEHGCDRLLAKLKSANAYPYSDLDRDPVVEQEN